MGENKMTIDIQELYEDILSAHWQKVVQLQELVKTDTGSALRRESIRKREAELQRILDRRSAIRLLFEDDLAIPDWYVDMCEKLGITNV